MRQLILINALLVLLATVNVLAQELPVNATVTIAEGSSCMGDDKSRKQTEEAARTEARRRAAEQALSLVRSETVVKDFELEKDLIAAYTQAKVRILDELDTRWDNDCYFYRIRAEVTPESKAMARIDAAKASGAVDSEENVAWATTQENQQLALVDDFIARYPLSPYIEEAKALRSKLVSEYPRMTGTYITSANVNLHFRPRDTSARIGKIADGEALEVVKVFNNDWAEVKRDMGVAYAQFSLLRPIDKEELSAWKRVQDSKDEKPLQLFIASYKQSYLIPKAQAKIKAIQAYRGGDKEISKADMEEIAFWNRCLQTRDLRDIREYLRRWPNGKYRKEAYDLLREITTRQ